MKEFELIAKLAAGEPFSGGGLLCGIGDDCAVIDGGENDWLVTADALVEGVHFERAWQDMEMLGRKALSVNLSDIAAMGGTPRFYLATVSIPPSCYANDMLALYAGMKSVARSSGAVLVGGDTTGSKSGLCISITAIGQCPHDSAIMRSGARPGDSIYVSGSLGGASLALALAKRGAAVDADMMTRLTDPRARVGLGTMLRETGLVTSMIDVSDGLLQDLGHIARRSGVGFEISAAEVPVPEGVMSACGRNDLDPMLFSLTGGEDYELLFTARPDFFSECGGEIEHEVSMIGRVVENSESRLVLDAEGNELKFEVSGFDHFGG